MEDVPEPRITTRSLSGGSIRFLELWKTGENTHDLSHDSKHQWSMFCVGVETVKPPRS
jgi:hypothetical protein